MNKQQRGFTFIELILVMVIVSVISIVVGRIMFQSIKTFIQAQNISEIEWQALLVLENVDNDVKSIRSNNDISTIGATTFTFVTATGANVTYQFSGSTLTRAGQLLATGIQSMAFTYFDKNYASTAVAANVRYVKINLVMVQNDLSLTFNIMSGTRGMT
jgi:prepilin-type N-terminal cleavage/methylation domain-containing protein